MKRASFTFLLLAAALALFVPGTRAKELGGAFEPVPGAQCRDLKTIADKALGAHFSISYDAPFAYWDQDASGNEKDKTWRGCTLTVKGTGREFPRGPGGVALKLLHAFKGWTEVPDNSFYGNCGGSVCRSALTRGNALIVIEAGWEPNAKARTIAEKKCPESPVESCVEHFKPEQLLYTITIHVARRK